MAEKQKRSYPPFYEKMVPIIVVFFSILTIILIAVTISLIIQ